MNSLIKLLAVAGIVYAASRIDRRASKKIAVPAWTGPLVMDREVFNGSEEIPEHLARILEQLSAEAHRSA